ncbi:MULTISPECIES: phosphoglucosamine mutase [Pseudoalteromonas]|uniref:Phosphoglucosamine mutase n=2 Tax=Pseudoalteromonas TaxID=53246 RepID=A0AAQ2ITD4_PSEO7|nr:MULTISPECIES: phosphoglucosamine mutase [Pseudoalteromonas]ATD06811.1 phosphoglucosamine mutase [Pseudoalteromonas piscicida]KID33146.1 phosphoglucosamine mutase [Pseudoalteromonas flavipulchra NCIMB 2033 = ATCC BAA-314]KJY89753.1 phosphoglucosamine mutase [Pseudoalteromonas piscicida]MBD0781671.1 phosphoglucosamine mutase [Pseudoalteromonas flavipulchra]MBE0373308.1 phosphoglucosamine mutase [Pseudoalteromonas flavipulchra NCIMB 2033 = ATCC BAA-314]
MTTRKYFGTDGVRGMVGEFPITPEFAMKLGWAAGKVLSERGTKKVIIGKDTRISGYLLETALEAGLIAAGINVILLGPMPTPAVAYLTQTFRAEAGIVISASHNPYHDNGIKFFGGDGKKLPDEVELAIEAKLDEPMTCVASEKLGKAKRLESADGRYIEFCKGQFPKELSLEGLKVVLDCANGATYHIAPSVMRELGADVITTACEPNGVNINEKCGATHVEALKKAVLEHQADVGIAYDGDGDRVMMVDHDGHVFDGDDIVYIIACQAHADGTLGGGVVGTVMSNMGLENALKSRGIAFERSKVGDRYVMELLGEKGWKIGGESSGHVLNLDLISTGDGIVSSLQVLAAMVAQNKTLKDLGEGFSKYPMKMINVRYSTKDDPTEQDAVKAVVAEVETQLAGKGRVLLRKSGTEPVVRVMVEAQQQKQVIDFAQKIAEVVESVSN